jgi:GTP cyclohydrolase I
MRGAAGTTADIRAAGAPAAPPPHMNIEKVQGLVGEFLTELGEDPRRDGLRRTPHRVATAFEFLTQGYSQDPVRLLQSACFDSPEDHMIIVKDVEIYSMCEHHMLPFYGRCHIGYVPRGRVVGISKLARLADMFARRLQLQERLTEQIAKTMMSALNAKGVGVVIEAHHLCLMMRGVQKQNSSFTTSVVLGTFLESHATREEFLTLISR